MPSSILEVSHSICVQLLMPLRRFRPSAGKRGLAEEDLFNGNSHMMGARLWPNFSNPSPQPWKGHGLHSIRNPFSRQSALVEHAVLDEEEDRTGRKVGVYRIVQFHRDSHGGGGNQKRNPHVSRFYDLGGTHKKLAMMLFADQRLEPLLNLPPEMLGICHVDPAVHEPKAVGRADDGIAVHVEDRPAMHPNALQVTAMLLPGRRQGVVGRRQGDSHRLGSILAFLSYTKNSEIAR